MFTTADFHVGSQQFSTHIIYKVFSIIFPQNPQRLLPNIDFWTKTENLQKLRYSPELSP